MATSTVSVNEVDESIFENKDVKVSEEQCKCPICSKEGVSLKECYDTAIGNYKKYGDASKSIYEIEHSENFDKRFIEPRNHGNAAMSKLVVSVMGLIMGLQFPHITKVMLEKTDNDQSQYMMNFLESMSGTFSLLSYIMIIMSLAMFVVSVMSIYKKKELDDEYEIELEKYNNSKYCEACNHVYENGEIMENKPSENKIKSKAHSQKKKK